MRHTWMIALLAARRPGSAGTRRVSETARWSVLLLSLSLALTGRHATAQGVSQHVPASAACMELNQTVLTQAAGGRLEKAETALSAALAGDAHSPEHSCAGLILSNLAASMAVSGRLAEAERFSERSVTILSQSVPPDDPVLLCPLQILAAARFEQGKTGMAREAFKRMQSIRIERPADRALVHSMAAALLHADGRFPEAESENLAAIRALEQAGRGATADAGAVLNALGSLYIEEQRLDEARRMLDRAFTIFTNDEGAVPMDRIKLLNVRGVLHTRLGEWRQAEQDLSEAVSMADRESRVDPVALASLLADYAYVLRRNHRGREARAIEVRAAALRDKGTADSVVDVTELLPKPKTAKK